MSLAIELAEPFSLEQWAIWRQLVRGAAGGLVGIERDQLEDSEEIGDPGAELCKLLVGPILAAGAVTHL